MPDQTNGTCTLLFSGLLFLIAAISVELGSISCTDLKDFIRLGIQTDIIQKPSLVKEGD